MPSTAEQFFQRIMSSTSGFSFVESLIELGRQEAEWLEFKSADKIGDKHVKEHWSKALSGFANTEGGVLIWGIDARRNSEAIDCATALALAPDADRFAQKLNDVLLDAVSPALTSVQIQAVKKDGQKEGFVVCLIPEGTHKAHRAELVENKPFYMRSRDKFFIPAVSVIRNLFTPRASALLVPHLSVAPAQGDSPLVLWLALINEGNLTAKGISLSIWHANDISYTPMRSSYTSDPTYSGARIGLDVGPKINPDMKLDTIYGFRYPSSNELRTRKRDFFDVSVKVSCEDCPSCNWLLRITYYDILKPQRLRFTSAQL